MVIAQHGNFTFAVTQVPAKIEQAAKAAGAVEGEKKEGEPEKKAE